MSEPRLGKSKDTKFVAFFKRLFLDNLQVKLLSLLLALLLWMFVMLVEDVTRTLDVPLRFKLPAGAALVSDIPKQARVLVSGPWATVKGFDAERLGETEIDLSEAELGTQPVFLEDGLFRMPPGLKVIKVTPSSISVTLAKRGHKEVAIVAATQGQPAEGYAVKSIKIQPERMSLEGSTSDLMFIDEVQTATLDLNGKHESFTASVDLIRPSKNIQLKQSTPVQVTVTIKRDVAEAILRNVMVEVRHSRYHAKVIPESISVTVMGPRSALQDMAESAIHAYVDATKEEGDIPGTSTVREVSFDPLPGNLKIKSQSYTVKLQLSAEAHTP